MEARFTKWYIRRGYTFDYDSSDIPVIGDEYIKTPCGIPKAIWNCPFWVKPLLVFFSPSTYCAEAWGRAAIEGLMKGLKETQSF